jgi:hypothetical protein
MTPAAAAAASPGLIRNRTPPRRKKKRERVVGAKGGNRGLQLRNSADRPFRPTVTASTYDDAKIHREHITQPATGPAAVPPLAAGCNSPHLPSTVPLKRDIGTQILWLGAQQRLRGIRRIQRAVSKLVAQNPSSSTQPQTPIRTPHPHTHSFPFPNDARFSIRRRKARSNVQQQLFPT